MNKWIPTILMLIILSPLGLSTPSPALAQEQAATRVATFQIQGMATPSCPVLVKAAVGKMDGVEKVSASLQTKTATVVYRPGSTSPVQIQKVIKDQVGFDSTIVKR